MRPRHAVFALVAALAMRGATAQTPRPATSALPARLTDAEFWRLTIHLSEPGGAFLSDNLVSNEIAFQRVLPRLAARVPEGGVYIGVGPEQNFTYIANLRPRMAFILDIRRQNLVEHLLYKALMELSPTRAGFVARLFVVAPPTGVDTGATARQLFKAIAEEPADEAAYAAHLRAVLSHLGGTRGFPLDPADRRSLDEIYRAFWRRGPDITYADCTDCRRSLGEFASYEQLQTEDDGRGRNLAFLGSEATYRTIRELQLHNLVVPVVGDFAGAWALPAIGDYVRDHRASVTTIYASNVEQYLFQEADVWPRYYTSVATLPLDPAAMFIRSVPDPAARSPGTTTSVLNGRVFVTTTGLGGNLMSMVSSVSGVLDAFRAGAIRRYEDIVALSDR